MRKPPSASNTTFHIKQEKPPPDRDIPTTAKKINILRMHMIIMGAELVVVACSGTRFSKHQ